MTDAPRRADEFARFAAEVRPQVETALERLLPAPATAPADLHRAMRYAVLPAGKLLRPALVVLGCRVTGGDEARVLEPAAGVELLHSYSLVHDDLPCMDDDDLRRGRPTCHKVFGEALAVLVGDALLTLAFEAVAAGGARAVRALARAAGSRGMVGGQAADIAAEGGAAAGATLDAVQWIHDHKTGALIAASLEIGALAGGGALACLEPLVAYGRLLGRAFQVADDCLDRSATAAELGKSTGQDQAAGKLTYPAVLGLQAARAEARALAAAAAALAPAACGAGSGGGLDSNVLLLQDLAFFAVTRKA
jgi:geranylgeranyl diphosphate synthase type II